MKPRLENLALMLGLALTAGCGESGGDGYVNFDQTAPSSLDQSAGQPQAGSANSAVNGAESKTIDVQPVSAGKQPDIAGVKQSILPDAANPADSVSSAEPAADAAGNDGSKVTGGAIDSPSLAESPGAPAISNPAAAPDAESEVTEARLNASDNQIVSRQTGLTGPADNPLIENAAAAEPRKVELLIPEKTFRKERGSNALRLSYDDLDLLKILNMEPVPTNAAEYFPDWLNALNGKSIRIRGFMYPTFEATGLTAFTLARDNGICCFVRQPKIYDIIAVKLADGVTSDYIEGRPFDVEGILRIEPQADETDLYRLYRIEDARVLR